MGFGRPWSASLEPQRRQVGVWMAGRGIQRLVPKIGRISLKIRRLVGWQVGAAKAGESDRRTQQSRLNGPVMNKRFLIQAAVEDRHWQTTDRTACECGSVECNPAFTRLFTIANDNMCQNCQEEKRILKIPRHFQGATIQHPHSGSGTRIIICRCRH